MIKKIMSVCVLFIFLYAAIIWLQVFLASRGGLHRNTESSEEATHKVYSFSFSKYNPGGEKEIEIEGDSADILSRTVALMNVVAKAYADQAPVTITADTGNYDKVRNIVHLRKNVVATTENGTRLLTEKLDIQPSDHVMETDVEAAVKKDNINVEGIGARGDSNLKKVKFRKKVTAVIQDPDDKTKGPTVITSEGPLVINYDKNIAHFKDNVLAKDARGKLSADLMHIYYDRTTRKVSKMIAVGNVAIENQDGNKTYGDHVVYLADQGKIIMGGDTEALYYEGDAVEEGFK